jgi:hypothetical protein
LIDENCGQEHLRNIAGISANSRVHAGEAQTAKIRVRPPLLKYGTGLSPSRQAYWSDTNARARNYHNDCIALSDFRRFDRNFANTLQWQLIDSADVMSHF